MCIDIYDQFSLSSSRSPIDGAVDTGPSTGDIHDENQQGVLCSFAIASATVTANGRQGERQWPLRFNPPNSEASVLSPEDEMKTFFLPPGYRVELVASEPMIQDPIADRLGSATAACGSIEMPATCTTSTATERARADRPRRRARGHEQRRQDGQADRVRRRPGAAARAEGAGPRRARRRAAEPLADARHQRRPEGRHQGARHRHATAGARQRRAQRQQPALGARQLDVHVRSRHATSG